MDSSKKVLLCEFKRHIICHIASTHSIVLSQGDTPVLSCPWKEPQSQGCYLSPRQGVLHFSPAGGIPCLRLVPPPGTGVAPTWDWGTLYMGLQYPPWEGTWGQSLGYSTRMYVGPVTWDQWQFYGMEMGYPPV